jgi:hypothetical protein
MLLNQHPTLSKLIKSHTHMRPCTLESKSNLSTNMLEFKPKHNENIKFSITTP